MRFFESAVSAPLVLPDGSRSEAGVYTGTACLALMDAAVTGEVWEDILYDGTGHAHGAGGLMLHPGAFGTHLEHDGDFPIETVLDSEGRVVAFRVNLDPYGADLAEVRHLDDSLDHGHVHDHGDLSHAHSHSHLHSPGHGHDGVDDHDHGHGHGHAGEGHPVRHPEGWSAPEQVRLVTDRAVFGDPAGLPEADDTGDFVTLVFPAAAGELSVTVLTDHGLRRELLAVWRP